MKQNPKIRELTASLNLQSDSAIKGPFPPSSSITFLRLDSAAACIHLLPTADEPVNEIMSISL